MDFVKLISQPTDVEPVADVLDASRRELSADKTKQLKNIYISMAVNIFNSKSKGVPSLLPSLLLLLAYASPES